MVGSRARDALGDLLGCIEEFGTGSRIKERRGSEYLYGDRKAERGVAGDGHRVNFVLNTTW